MGLGEKYTAMDFWNAVYELDGDSHAKTVLGDFYFSEGDYRMAEKYGKGKRRQKNPQMPKIKPTQKLMKKKMKDF